MRTILAVLVVVAAVAGCGTSETPASSAPAAAAPTQSVRAGVPTPGPSTATTPRPAAPTPAPSTTPSTAPDRTVYEVDDLVRVATDDLRMRSEPGVDDGSRRLEPLLQRGTIARVLAGPVEASGYTWYRLRTMSSRRPAPAVGWVAAGDGEDRWIRAESRPCPEGDPDVADLIKGRFDVLACFGGRPIRVTARLGADETGPCFEFEPGDVLTLRPSHFGPCASSLFLVAPDTRLDSSAYGAPQYRFALFGNGVPQGLLAAEAYRPRNWPLVTVTGQFDHESARRCRAVGEGTQDSPLPDPEVLVLDCRTTFVVTAIEAARP